MIPKWGCLWLKSWVKSQHPNWLKILSVWGLLLTYSDLCWLCSSMRRGATIGFWLWYWMCLNTCTLWVAGGSSIFRTIWLIMGYGAILVRGGSVSRCIWNSKCMRACWGWNEEQVVHQARRQHRQKRRRRRRSSKAKSIWTTEVSKQKQLSKLEVEHWKKDLANLVVNSKSSFNQRKPNSTKKQQSMQTSFSTSFQNSWCTSATWLSHSTKHTNCWYISATCTKSRRVKCTSCWLSSKATRRTPQKCSVKKRWYNGLLWNEAIGSRNSGLQIWRRFWAWQYGLSMMTKACRTSWV